MITIRSSLLLKLPTRTLRRDLSQILKCAGVPNYDLGILFTDDAHIRTLNKRYRNKDRPTDILSFPFQEAITPGNLPPPLTEDDKNLGDMIISIPYVARWCREHGETLHARFPVLFAHGVCHLLGYDHETDEDYLEMHDKESRILESFWEWKGKLGRRR
ncbi:uncharacterized protein VTP21DRAFT_1644 [Calcarisporiella thermophila]|uniref:uncharacterized protein n=1 Tax=Calcarisporiella thermophila TaxID=911321 RepID=UPI0037432166